MTTDGNIIIETEAATTIGNNHNYKWYCLLLVRVCYTLFIISEGHTELCEYSDDSIADPDFSPNSSDSGKKKTN